MRNDSANSARRAILELNSFVQKSASVTQADYLLQATLRTLRLCTYLIGGFRASIVHV